jgi:hypothetical protein
MFAEEEETPIKVTSDGLRKGISLKVNFPDGRMFLIERR